MSVVVRAADAADASFLADMLAEAAFWRPDGPHGTRQDVLRQPNLVHYVTGWPRGGDLGVVAEDDLPVGAAWLRFFTSDGPGYGFVDETVPEISMAVVRPHRGQGIGRLLLDTLIIASRGENIPALSLSVEPDNYARRLYEHAGFQQAGHYGGAITMILRL
ncbi:MAG: GNAT family N-acetyltransferase [Rhodococcus sp.]|nr:GNAT family N-acetyltransferase [Rhodococcus sp. (in: high G+C Gram-positive bacteria)]